MMPEMRTLIQMRQIQRDPIQDECGKVKDPVTMRIKECVDDTTTQ